MVDIAEFDIAGLGASLSAGTLSHEVKEQQKKLK